MLDAFRDWLTGLDSGFYLAIWAGAAILTLVFLFLGFRTLIRARIIAHTPTSRLRSAAQGFNEIEGTGRAVDDHSLYSPLSFTPCLWFDMTIERLESSGKNRRWVTVERRRSDAVFRVDDDTDEAFVDPDHARVIPHSRRRWRERGVRRGWSTGSSAGFGGQAHRYTEQLLLPEQPLYVLGWLETRGHRNDGGSDLDAVEQRRLDLLREWKTDETARQRFDLDGDGEISEREWSWAMRLARAQARRDVSDADRERVSASNVVHLMRRPDNGDPFIISGLPQDKLVRRKTLKAGAFITGSLVLFVFWLIAQTTRSVI
ncbi:E3 ubiquitin ligase family protein [Guyparkeria hydrothermalis]|uniref:E3 ubiquitin ligase family protein n=1 Tax=Guyparkeria hydrothermalis TaxID=923 RepID=UPI002020CC6F|nr:E3 ubiquitin ligase family protein [Guyparkeria hydrothermalis]MCL7744969.1 E3 ubiquitin ligase family protein [Guyparkeria hydrothermalis]